MAQWTFEQEEIVIEALRRHWSNQLIAEMTGHSVPSIKRKKHNLRYGRDDKNSEPDMPTKTELQKVNDAVIAAFYAAKHDDRETKLRTVK